MAQKKVYRALGLMSGTSLDGIDVALIETDGETILSFGPSATFPYDPDFRESLRSRLGRESGNEDTERALTLHHRDAILNFLTENRIAKEQVDLIGFHGHTLWHKPEQGRTCQIGDGALLAKETGISVVCDFRSNDVEQGGEGAPLAPVFHRALADNLEKPIALLNVGGVSNVTWLSPEGEIIAFDTGPGNALIDDWVRQNGAGEMDEGGALGLSGTIDVKRVATFMEHPYFAKPVPKSLDRDDFARLATELVAGMTLKDGAATLAAFTAASVSKSVEALPSAPKRWLVCGGGRHNDAIMEMLRQQLGVPVEAVDAQDSNWNGDAIEAQAFAFMAVRSKLGLAISFPGTTGVSQPLSGGRVFVP